jgi:hypothetical protein
MIDSSRHFLPVRFLEHIVDTMVASKFNVLHWHISDTESFPSSSALFPELAEKGAWSPEAVYSVPDLKHVVDYAYKVSRWRGDYVAAPAAGAGRVSGCRGETASAKKACPSAAKAGRISGCRGETPRTPPAAGGRGCRR